MGFGGVLKVPRVWNSLIFLLSATGTVSVQGTSLLPCLHHRPGFGAVEEGCLLTWLWLDVLPQDTLGHKYLD